MRADGTDVELVSTGEGRTTCGCYLPDGGILYASTHGSMTSCPPGPDFSQGCVWALNPEYEIYAARRDGSGLQALTDSPGYDAEATVSPLGDRIIFTSFRDGDLELYTMGIDGSDVERITRHEDFDSFPMFGPDGKYLVWASNRNGQAAGETNVFVAEWVEGPDGSP
ncbi:MAG: hypothetical protein R6W82_06300 [bacterium]